MPGPYALTKSAFRPLTSTVILKGESGIATPSHVILISYFPGSFGVYVNLTKPALLS